MINFKQYLNENEYNIVLRTSSGKKRITLTAQDDHEARTKALKDNPDSTLVSCNNISIKPSKTDNVHWSIRKLESEKDD